MPSYEDRKEYYQAYYEANRERINKRTRAWAQKNKDRVREYDRNWKAKNPDKIRDRGRKYYSANRDHLAIKAKEYRTNLREEFLREYGNMCRCCGETQSAFLTLEHKNRDGSKHREEFHCSAQQLADLRRRGWPKDDYEILCFNCNRATWELGTCPHMMEKQQI